MAQCEALLFSEGGEMLTKDICNALSIDVESLVLLVQEYNAREHSGMVLIMDNTKLIMRVAGEHADLIKRLRQDEQKQEISKAGLEVLAIVLYSQGEAISASEIEHIRGVNSNYTLRQLTMRGLLSRSRRGMSYQYAPTAELLSFLGITTRADLPGIKDIQEQIKYFKDTNELYDNK